MKDNKRIKFQYDIKDHVVVLIKKEEGRVINGK